MRIRYKILSYSIIAMLLFSGGYLIAVYSNGGTPTIDPVTGMSNFPWYNATQGVNAPEFYLNSEDKTDLLEYPEQAASYIIFKEGSTVYAKNGATGKIDYSGTNASLIIQNTIDKINGGTIYLRSNTYILSTYITLKSNINLLCERASILKASDNFDVSITTDRYLLINIPSRQNISIQGISFDLNQDNQIHPIGAIYIRGSNVKNINIRDCLIEEPATSLSYSPFFLTIWGGSEYNDIQNIVIKNNKFIVEDSIGSNFASIKFAKSIIIENNIHLGHDTFVINRGVNGINIVGNIIIGSAAILVDAESGSIASKNLKIEDNLWLNSGHTQYQTGGAYISLVPNAAGIDFEDIDISGNIIEGDTGQLRDYGISIIEPYSTGNIKSVRISGNRITNGSKISKHGIYVKLFNQKDANISINDNVINNPTRRGIYITNSDSSLIIGNQIISAGTGETENEGIRIDTSEDVQVIGNQITSSYGPNVALVSTDNGIILGNIIKNSQTSVGIYIKGTNNIIKENRCYDDQDSKTQSYGIYEVTDSDYNIINSNNVNGNKDGGIVFIGNNDIVSNNIGFITENSGIATLLNGQTTKVVSHGCDYTPSAGDIYLHPIEPLGNAVYWYVDTITSTQFTIHVDVNPGQDVDFAWSVDRH